MKQMATQPEYYVGNKTCRTGELTEKTVGAAQPEEDRFITFGFSVAGQLLMVAHTDRGDRIRIISARILTRAADGVRS